MPTQIENNLQVTGYVFSTAQGLLVGSTDTMEKPAAESKDVVVFYTGETTDWYVQNSWYICRTHDGGISYVWEPIILEMDKLWDIIDTMVPRSFEINGHPLMPDARGEERLELTAKDVHALPDTTKIPQKVTDLPNDGPYLTQDVSTLSNYHTKPQIARILEDFAKVNVVESIPKEPKNNQFYAIKKSDGIDLYLCIEGTAYKI